MRQENFDNLHNYLAQTQVRIVDIRGLIYFSLKIIVGNSGSRNEM